MVVNGCGPFWALRSSRIEDGASWRSGWRPFHRQAVASPGRDRGADKEYNGGAAASAGMGCKRPGAIGMREIVWSSTV